MPVSAAAELKVDPAMKEHFGIEKKDINVQVIDISSGGAGLLSKYFIPKGVIVGLSFQISGKMVEAKGEIRSAVSGGTGLTRLGVKFIEIGKGEIQLIEETLKEYERRKQSRLTL